MTTGLVERSSERHRHGSDFRFHTSVTPVGAPCPVHQSPMRSKARVMGLEADERARGQPHRSSGWHQGITESSDCQKQFPAGFCFGHDSIDKLAGFVWNLTPGKHDYGSSRSETPYFMGKLVPIHFRHLVTENNCVKAIHFRKLQSASP